MYVLTTLLHWTITAPSCACKPLMLPRLQLRRLSHRMGLSENRFVQFGRGPQSLSMAVVVAAPRSVVAAAPRSASVVRIVMAQSGPGNSSIASRMAGVQGSAARVREDCPLEGAS